VCLRSVEYSSRIVYCISFDSIEVGRRFNDSFDPYGSLSLLTLRRALRTDRMLHVISSLR